MPASPVAGFALHLHFVYAGARRRRYWGTPLPAVRQCDAPELFPQWEQEP